MAVVSDVLDLRKFVAPEFVFGDGARHLVGRYARNLGGSHVLVVTDPGTIAAGWGNETTNDLKAQGIACVVFSQVSCNPRAEEVMTGAEVYLRERCNVIVAIGGGSPMDCAKGIGIVSSNRQHVLEFAGVDRVPIPIPPLICIPTTAGTSADVSQFAIITDSEKTQKIAIVSKAVVPDVALIDPRTTITMDAKLTACTGIDALVHAIEAYVSNAHSPITDLHAIEAIRLVAENLCLATRQPENIEVRAKMMLGSLYAGLAFSNASLGAVHAMAHSLGGLLDFAHGEANALLLRHVIEFNFEMASDRYLKIGEVFGLADPNKETLLDAVDRLLESVGICHTLRDRGLRRESIPTLSEKAMRDACMVTNPRRPTQQDIEMVYEKAL
jgi:alcohol dehydrogenase class IV